MIFHGIVQNGQIILPEPLPFPDGTSVEVAPAIPSSDSHAPGGKGQTYYELLEETIGVAGDMPSNLSDQHDEYRSLRRP